MGQEWLGSWIKVVAKRIKFDFSIIFRDNVSNNNEKLLEGASDSVLSVFKLLKLFCVALHVILTRKLFLKELCKTEIISFLWVQFQYTRP